MQKKPHAEQTAKTRDLDPLGQIEAIRYTWNADVVDVQSNDSINRHVEQLFDLGADPYAQQSLHRYLAFPDCHHE